MLIVGANGSLTVACRNDPLHSNSLRRYQEELIAKMDLSPDSDKRLEFSQFQLLSNGDVNVVEKYLTNHLERTDNWVVLEIKRFQSLSWSRFANGQFEDANFLDDDIINTLMRGVAHSCEWCAATHEPRTVRKTYTFSVERLTVCLPRPSAAYSLSQHLANGGHASLWCDVCFFRDMRFRPLFTIKGSRDYVHFQRVKSLFEGSLLSFA